MDDAAGSDGPEPSTAALVLFGDWFAPHRPDFWLGELIDAVSAVGVNPRSTRTVAQRFANSGWFDVQRIGRRSRYALTELARAELRRGDLRILDAPRTEPAARWTLVSLEGGRTDAALAKQLAWLGLGELRRDLWLSPYAPDDALRHLLDGHPHEIFLDARVDGTDRELVHRCWDLSAAEAAYARLLRRPRPSGLPADDRLAFVERFHLNHDFLLAVRVDPQLPTELLPPDWPGTEARTRFTSRRAELAPAAGAYLRRLAEHHDAMARGAPAA